MSFGVVAATISNCIHYQETAALFANDAAYHIDEGALLAAVRAQEHAREYHDAAWDRLSRLIGVA